MYSYRLLNVISDNVPNHLMQRLSTYRTQTVHGGTQVAQNKYFKSKKDPKQAYLGENFHLGVCKGV